MRYAGIIKNDIAAAPGVCVSFFVQGCSFHCKGCHNQDSWSFKGGREFTDDTMKELIEAISANGVKRDLCIMGGEPMHPNNTKLTKLVVEEVKKVYPDIKIYLWSGYLYEELKTIASNDETTDYILNNIYCLIDGKFELDKRDVTLHMRGSSNQRVIYMN